MNRRHFVETVLAGTSLAVFSQSAASAASAAAAGAAGEAVATRLPKRDRVRVAFMVGHHANVIDTAGPWEVFQDTVIGHRQAFELYLVAPEEGTLEMTGGLRVQPHYTIEDAPQPHVIVIPAHRATDASRAWLRKASEKTDVTMSVCTGAFQLARTGLLNGLPATTHHDFWDDFEKEFPEVKLRRGLRFIDNGRLATAGGLTSGIDLALHIVARYFGTEAATTTARYMEYSSEAWRT